jgi:hypothetical protein
LEEYRSVDEVLAGNEGSEEQTMPLFTIDKQKLEPVEQTNFTAEKGSNN